MSAANAHRGHPGCREAILMRELVKERFGGGFNCSTEVSTRCHPKPHSPLLDHRAGFGESDDLRSHQRLPERHFGEREWQRAAHHCNCSCALKTHAQPLFVNISVNITVQGLQQPRVKSSTSASRPRRISGSPSMCVCLSVKPTASRNR